MQASAKAQSRKSRRPEDRVWEVGKPQNRRKKATKTADTRIRFGRVKSRKISTKKQQETKTPG